ncbi:LytTR family transcriptional regulator DNA-binding domain-containing protein [Pedobacter psychroterrae]|uniref:HTH LytTR-type domain-containing protein n=1 Tax=Pedobacter psychroterrae TaxID=2530453 RepID=A0A4R0NM20_9SPHI|nr:hypothetical protein EZ437_13195 [Pedobacter psychroterrae]
MGRNQHRCRFAKSLKYNDVLLLRIHKSYIINIDQIDYIEKNEAVRTAS